MRLKEDQKKRAGPSGWRKLDPHEPSKTENKPFRKGICTILLLLLVVVALLYYQAPPNNCLRVYKLRKVEKERLAAVLILLFLLLKLYQIFCFMLVR